MKTDKRNTPKNIRIFCVIIFLIALALVYYNYLNNKASDRREEASKTELEALLDYNFESNYPKTIRDVVKLHCRYLKTMYNEDISEEDLVTLNKNIRNIYADELNNYNSENNQLQSLKTEITKYKDASTMIVSYTTSESSQIQYSTIEGKEYAKIDAEVNIKVKTKGSTIKEQYLLCKDDKERWKIVGWSVVEEENE